ncbi:hypothetical protein H671_8g18890 [Cricetulus griseus]|nr:hypothetical protein H671_8g18890 [Cricetulus griseus]
MFSNLLMEPCTALLACSNRIESSIQDVTHAEGFTREPLALSDWPPRLGLRAMIYLSGARSPTSTACGLNGPSFSLMLSLPGTQNSVFF